MCVQGVDVQCVLQFTLVNAAGCALHRRTSRVIHRIELSQISKQPSTVRATRTERLRPGSRELGSRDLRSRKAKGFALTINCVRKGNTRILPPPSRLSPLNWPATALQTSGGEETGRSVPLEAAPKTSPLPPGDALFKPDSPQLSSQRTTGTPQTVVRLGTHDRAVRSPPVGSDNATRRVRISFSFFPSFSFISCRPRRVCGGRCLVSLVYIYI